MPDKYALVKDGEVVEVFDGYRGVTVGQIQHSADIFRFWSLDNLKDIGILPYFIRRNGDTNVQVQAASVVTVEADAVYEDISYVDRPLAGLKEEKLKNIRSTSYEDLKDTDWYVLREYETGVPIPNDIKTYRAGIRAFSNMLETSVNNVVSVSSFKDVQGTINNSSNDKPVKPVR